MFLLLGFRQTKATLATLPLKQNTIGERLVGWHHYDLLSAWVEVGTRGRRRLRVGSIFGKLPRFRHKDAVLPCRYRVSQSSSKNSYHPSLFGPFEAQIARHSDNQATSKIYKIGVVPFFFYPILISITWRSNCPTSLYFHVMGE